MKEEYSRSGMLTELRSGILRDKVRKLVLKKAKITGETQAQDSAEESQGSSDSSPSEPNPSETEE